MPGDSSAPRRALVAVVAAPFVGIGGALFAWAAAWPAWAGILGAASGTLAATALLSRRADRRGARAAMGAVEPSLRRRQEALAVRRLWETARDFDAGGWGRRDLDALRLVSMNIEPFEPLHPRVAERLRTASSAVRAGVTERLAAAAAAATTIGLAPDAAEFLRCAAETLDVELARGACRAGEAVPFAPGRVADAVANAVAACQALRDELRPRVVCSLADAVRDAADAALAQGAGRAPGRLAIDLKSASLPLVAVLPSDLLEALAGTLTRALAHGRLVGPLSVAAEGAVDGLDVRITWAVEDRYALDPAGALEPLRALNAYGARADVRESIEESALEIVLRLPRYVTREECGGGVEREGAAS